VSSGFGTATHCNTLQHTAPRGNEGGDDRQGETLCQCVTCHTYAYVTSYVTKRGANHMSLRLGRGSSALIRHVTRMNGLCHTHMGIHHVAATRQCGDQARHT